ncbi:LLM class flavin-dependent oxidoreductase [Thermasporomyces composti]|nr:LLM class flavin-dependent oxidoreductase [Thermasporomyces composti]
MTPRFVVSQPPECVMKIGLALYPRHLPYRPEPLEELYGSFLDNAVYAEELGYSHVWMGEHHFSPDAWPPSTLVLLTHVAARTSRIRLGTGMLLMPFHHPLRVAEDAIVLDVLSHGRLDLGFSVGSAFHEYRTFNVPMSERLGRTQEGVEVVRRCFTEDRFDHHGKYYDFPDVRMEWYRPVQRPHPPIWIGAFGPKAFAWAGRNGYHINLGYTPLYEQVYLPALEAAGHDPRQAMLNQLVYCHVAPTRTQAWDEAEEGFRWVIEYYQTMTGAPGISDAGPLPPGTLPPLGEFRNTPGIGFGGKFIVGTPDDLTRHLEQVAKTPATHVALALGVAGMSKEQMRRSMELIAERVLPRFHDT